MNDADADELNHWAAIFLDKSRRLPGIADVATDQENAGPLLDMTIKREVASSYGILPSTIDNTLDDAFGQRIVSTMYTPLNQYHVVLEVEPQFQTGPEALSGIYLSSSSGQQVPLCTLVDTPSRLRRIVINHQGHVSLGHDLVQSGGGRGARRCGRCDPRLRAAKRQAGLARDELPGQRPGVSDHRSPARRF